MLRTILDVSAVTLILIAAIFLARSSYGLSAQDIAQISQTNVGYSPEVVVNLSEQQANARVGVVLLILAFLFQFRNLVTPVTISELEHDLKLAVITLIIAFAVVFSISSYLSYVISKHTQDKVTNILLHRSQN
jgi:hypothetical protein